MRNLLFLVITLIYSVSAFSQDCEGVPCLANPNIIQDDIIICYQEGLDTNSWCPPSSNECYQVCENSYNTYSTVYNVGSLYSWTVIGGQVITPNNSGNVITVLWGSQGAGNVAVEEIDSTGCTQIASVCVTLITKPIASISTIPSTTTICQNTNIQFLAENLNSTTLTSPNDSDCTQQQGWDSTGVYAYDLAYFWDFGDGSTSIDQNPFHVYNASGSYTISLIIANSCQCADTITTTIQVINMLGPEITTTCVGTVCEGDTIEYCTNAISPSWIIEGGVLYNSLNTDNCINVIWDNSDNELNDGLGSLLLVDLSSNCGTSESIMNIPAVPTNPFITGEVNPCDNTYQKYSFACIPGVNYSWQIVGAPWGVAIVDGWGTSEITIENLWASGASYQVLLDISSSTLQCSFNQISLNIDLLPKFYISGNETLCDSNVATYYSSSGGIVEWAVLNGTIQSPVAAPYIDSQIDVIWDQGYGAGIVKAIPTSAGVFCNDLATLSINIIENPQEPLNIINDVLGDTLICPGETYLYTIDPTNTTSTINSTYSWTITGGTPATHNGDNCMISWNAIGPYSIEAVNITNGFPYCQSSSFLKTINSLSLASPVISGNTVVCTNDRSNFEITNIYPNDAIITWGVVDASLGSVVSGQGGSDVIIEWGDQLGSTDITVTVDICGVTVSSIFSVSLIGASISFTTPGNIICPQSNVTFLASSAIGDFSWNFGDGNTTTLTNTSSVSHSYSTAGEYNVVLTLVDGNQCTSIASNLVEISGPVGHINPNPNSGIIEYCNGHTISEVLSVTTASNANPASWEWYHNGTMVQNGGNTYPLTLTPPNYTEAGTYSIVLTDLNGCSNTIDNLNLNIINCGGGGGSCNGGSCGTCPNTPIPYVFSCNSNAGTWDINFTSPNGNPANFYVIGVGAVSNTINASFTFSDAGTYHVICRDLNGNHIGHEDVTIPFVVDWKFFPYCDAVNNNQITIHFRDTSSYLLGINGLSYHWDFGDGTTSTLQNPSHTYAIPGTYTVDFTVSYGGLTCTKSQQVEAEFNALFIYSGPECEQTPTISFLSSNIQILSWQWDFDDGASSARETPERTYSQAGLYNPSLLATSIDGCVDNITVPLVIYSKPAITSLTPINSLCVNDPQLDLSLVASYSNTNGEIESWAGNGVEYISGTYYFNPLLAGGGTHEVCITITDINNCTESQCINVIVICPEKPRVFGKSDYCYDPYTWNQYLNTQSGFANYTWYIDNVLHSGPLSWSGVYINNTVGTYDITVSFEDNNGCTGISDPFILKVHPAPNPVYVSSTGVCPDSYITLTHNGSQNNVNYYWNTIPQQTGNSANVIAEANYEYQVIAVNEFGCESNSYNWIEIPNNVDMCNILSGCFCDSSIININGLIEINGFYNSWMYSSYEWLINGNSFVPAQNWGSLIIDPSDPNYLNLITGNITLSVIDYYGCSYTSEDLIIETNCISCISTVTDFYTSPSICDGDVMIVGANTYSTPGNYIDVLVSSVGCDSIIHTNLTVLPNAFDTQNVVICDGESIVVGSNTYTTQGWYTDVLTAFNGCDSTLYTNLTVLPNASNNETVYLCSGDTLFVGNNFYTQTGIYTNFLVAENGCDSVLTIDLIVNPVSYTNLNPIICEGENVNVANSTYFISGVYYDTIPNIYNCDSIITTNLTVNPSYYHQQLFQACLGDSINVGNNYYTSTGAYTDSLQSVDGCDSVLFTQVIIEDPVAILTATPPLLYLNILNGTLPFSYTIGNQNGPLINSSNNIGTVFSFNPVVNGNYYVIVTDSVGCISDTVFFVVDFIPTSITFKEINNLVIFPNPSSDIFNISFNSIREQNLRIRVFNVIGEDIISDNLHQFIGNYIKQIDLTNNSKGLYFLEIETDKGVINQKLILH